MSETKTPWTPAPWEIAPDRSGLAVVVADADILLEGTGGARSYSHVVCAIDFQGEQQWANGRLIAAAPEMAEALFDIQSKVCAHSWDHADEMRRSLIVNEIWWLVENILRKARGEEA